MFFHHQLCLMIFIQCVCSPSTMSNVIHPWIFTNFTDEAIVLNICISITQFSI